MSASETKVKNDSNYVLEEDTNDINFLRKPIYNSVYFIERVEYINISLQFVNYSSGNKYIYHISAYVVLI